MKSIALFALGAAGLAAAKPHKPYVVVPFLGLAFVSRTRVPTKAPVALR